MAKRYQENLTIEDLRSRITNNKIHSIDFDLGTLTIEQRKLIGKNFQYIAHQFDLKGYKAAFEKQIHNILAKFEDINSRKLIHRLHPINTLLYKEFTQQRFRDETVNKLNNTEEVHKLFNMLANPNGISKFNSLKKNDEKTIMKQLMILPSTIFKPTDKNLGPCIMSTKWYHKQCIIHLLKDDTFEFIDFLEETPRGPDKFRPIQFIEQTKRLLKAISIQYFSKWTPNKNDIKDEILANVKELPAKFYIIPKVHKSEPTSRPIAADHSSILTPTSNMLAIIFNNNIKPDPVTNISKYPTIIKDTYSLINNDLEQVNKLNLITEDTIILTADVTALYPSMTISYHGQIMRQVIRDFKYKTYKGFNFDSDLLTKLFFLVLTRHTVQYTDHEGKTLVFHQLKGTATGTALAPAYANLALSALETNIITDFKENIILFRRFIDDILLIWKGSLETLKKFQTSLQEIYKLELTWKQGPNIEFLDLNLSINNSQITYKTYQKKINNYLYLPYGSAHPKQIFEGITKGEIIRYCRTNRNFTDFIEITKMLFTRLIQRGYPADLLNNTLHNMIYNIIGKDKTKNESNHFEINGLINLFNYYKLQNQPIFSKEKNTLVPQTERTDSKTKEITHDTRLILPYFNMRSTKAIKAVKRYLEELTDLEIQTAYTIQQTLGHWLLRADDF